jgi:hypothetical protein
MTVPSPDEEENVELGGGITNGWEQKFCVNLRKLCRKHELVEALQRTLNARLDPSPNLGVDGDFGLATQRGVLAFHSELTDYPKRVS